jgi:hypothetical protein
VGVAGPAVEVADDRDVVGVGRPDREEGACASINSSSVRAQLVPEPQVAAFIEKMQVMVTQEREVVSDIVRNL